MNSSEVSFKQLIAYTKEYGFIYPSSEIYSGLQAIYDYGPNGIAIKRNLQEYWWKSMTMLHNNIVGLDSAILMNPLVWKASGHIDNFHDIMVDNKDSKKRYRVDTLIEDHVETLQSKKPKLAEKILKSMNLYIADKNFNGLKNILIDENIKCLLSNSSNWTDVKEFNLMFETRLGPTSSEKIYLRPETAQGIFTNFLNVVKSMNTKIPFGIAQIGKAFRNEIVARQFIFRMREFEQMEMQFFIPPNTQKEWFEFWKEQRLKWYKNLEIFDLNIYKHEQLAHYADDAVDLQYKFPFGIKEVEGIHSRTDFDLRSHEKLSKKKIKFFDSKTNKSYIPYVIETSVGCDRLLLMVLCNSLKKEYLNEKERIYLKIIPAIAPIKVAVMPLVKKDGLLELAEKFYRMCKIQFESRLDINQSIGKRYTKQDLIGTPFCITVDYQTKEDGTLTLRDRDSTKQKRYKIDQIIDKIKSKVCINNLLGKIYE